VLAGLALVVTAVPSCGSASQEVVTIFSTETSEELEVLQAVFAAYSADHDVTVEVEGSREFEQEVNSRIAAGNAPDIALFPQPSRVRELAERLVPLPDEVLDTVEDDFAPGLLDLVRANPSGQPLAVPTKSDLKSLVWYNPREFVRHGYSVPTTFEGFLDLADRMAAAGHPPFCVGLGSGVSSGWPATDWVEDFVLRLAGPDVYDAWVEHRTAFDDPRVLEAAAMVFERWAREGYVFGGTDAAAITHFEQAGWPVVDGECMMHRQANFYEAFLPDDAEVGPSGNVYAFRLPGSADFPDVMLTGGQYAAPFSDRDEVQQVMGFLASDDFAGAMAARTGGAFLSPHRGVDIDLYEGELTQELGRTLVADNNVVRFDASDLMPSEAGSTFWSAVLAATDDPAALAEAFANVEENWPT
jgi:alpha-glucoside transport system substrate-binding protein